MSCVRRGSPCCSPPVRWRQVLLSAALLLAWVLGSPGAAHAEEARPAGSPRLSSERIVLRTIAGDVAIALYPDVAPGHAAQLIKLARLGIWSSTHFHRIHPGFVAQVSSAEDRTEPFTDEQRAAITPILAELSTLQHRRGTVSMAHPDEDVDGARTSFSILLGTAPHLDGKYTIVGEVVAGMEVFDRLVEVPAPAPSYRPPVRMRIHKVELFDTALAYAAAALQPAHAVFPRGIGAAPTLGSGGDAVGAPVSASGGSATGRERSAARDRVLLILLLVMTALGVAQGLLRARLDGRSVSSLGLLIALVGAFALLILLDPGTVGAEPAGSSISSELTGGLVFLGLVGLFRLLAARFEA